MSRNVVAVILGSLLAILAWEWIGWRSPALTALPKAPSGAAEQPLDPSADLVSQIRPLDSRDAYALIVERPVFRPDRKPEPEEEPEAAPSSEGDVELASVHLTAIMITPESVSAWVQKPDKKGLVKLRVGGDISGWVVKEVLEDRVHLERQGENYDLVLRDYSKSPPPQASAKPPVARPRPPAPRPPLLPRTQPQERRAPK